DAWPALRIGPRSWHDGPVSGRGSLIFTLLGLLLVLCVLEATALIGAWLLHAHHAFGEEIAWLEGWERYRIWQPDRHATIDQLYLDRVRTELLAGRLDRAANAARLARQRFRESGRADDEELLNLAAPTATPPAHRPPPP